MSMDHNFGLITVKMNRTREGMVIIQILNDEVVIMTKVLAYDSYSACYHEGILDALEAIEGILK